MTLPSRIRMSRAPRYSLQRNSLALNGLPAVNCARPGFWGNPFIVGAASGCEFQDGGDPTPMISALALDQCIKFYADALHGFLSPEMHPHGHRWVKRWRDRRNCHPMDLIGDLRGKNLGCFCKLDARCHCDVLLARANGWKCEGVDP